MTCPRCQGLMIRDAGTCPEDRAIHCVLCGHLVYTFLTQTEPERDRAVARDRMIFQRRWHSRKLTPTEVQRIVVLLAKPHVTQQDLAARFQVSAARISQIANRSRASVPVETE